MEKNPSVRPLIDFNQAWIELFGDSVPFAQTALLVKKQFADEHPAQVSRYLSELKKSISWVNAHPDSAAQLMVKYRYSPRLRRGRQVGSPL